MSCLDNTDILRIVGGNSFQIAITVKARRVADGSEIEDFDLSASSPVLNLIHAGEKTRKYFVTQGNQAIISFDGSEGLGYYGMEMSGSYNSESWRFCIEKVLQLVDTNAKANIPEWSFLVDDTYFIEGTISIYGGGGGGDTVQADWTETNPTSAAFILHKPDLSVYATKTEVASGLAGKQDTIVDLTSIRYGAAAGATAYQKPGTGIPESDMSDGVQTSLGKADSAYQKPSSGIPATDMDSEVQAALEKANSAVQTETDPVFSGSPAAEITQADINNWNAKQPAIADLADIRDGAAAGATAVQPDEMAQAIDEVDGDIADINAKIPTAASNLNQLADKAYVNSSIATNSATYRGSFNLITDLGMNVDATHAQIAGALATAIVTADNNDYAFVQIPDSASTPTVIAKIERYKHNGSGWVYEYDLNNSGFTAAQWAAINSGITSGLVGKLADLPNNSELATLLNGKQNVINDLSAIREGAAAGASAIQPADLTEALNGVEAEIAGLDESKQDAIEDLSTIRSGAAAGATAYQKPGTGIPESDMSDGVQTSLGKADSAYQKPSSGIPATDMSESVQESLAKANSAVQTETDPVFSGSPAAEITQADINNWNAKQPAIADLADIREGAAAGATAVQPDEMAQAIDEVDGDIDAINAKIPTAASNLNQLADKAYVNSSIATNSATYRGSFNLITDLGMNVDATHAQIAGALATAISTADNNDYAFVQIPDSASTPTVIAKIERYKHNGSGWVYEYDLNNSGFTAAQWAAINSGITSGLVGKLADLPNNSELATLLNGKQNVISDLSAIRSGAAAGATAYQKPSGGIPASDMSSTVQQELSKANTAVQTETDPIFSASPAAGITVQNIQTWNGEPAARQAADTALQTAIQDEATARATADALLQQQYNALTQSDIIVGALPASGVPNVIYRVPGTTDFTDYMWYDNQFVPMATYGLPISAEFVVDDNLNMTQEEINEEINGLVNGATPIELFPNSIGNWSHSTTNIYTAYAVPVHSGDVITAKWQTNGRVKGYRGIYESYPEFGQAATNLLSGYATEVSDESIVVPADGYFVFWGVWINVNRYPVKLVLNNKDITNLAENVREAIINNATNISQLQDEVAEINNDIDGLEEDFAGSAVQIQQLNGKIGNVRTKTTDISIDTTQGGINGSVGSAVNVTSSNGYRHGYLQVSPGEKYTITTSRTTSAYYPYYVYFTDNNDIIIDRKIAKTDSGGLVTETVEVPLGVTKMYLLQAGGNTVVLVVKKNVLYDLQSQIDDSSAGIDVDENLSFSSSNPVANKTITPKIVANKMLNDHGMFNLESNWWITDKYLEAEYAEQEATALSSFMTTFRGRAGSGVYQIAVISDTHGSGAYTWKNIQRSNPTVCHRSIAVFNKIAAYCDAALHGGDLSCDYGTSRYRDMQYMYEIIRKFAFNKPFFVTKGNHDENNNPYVETDMLTLDWSNKTYYARDFESFTPVAENAWDGSPLYENVTELVSDKEFRNMVQHWLSPTGAVWGNGAYYYYDIDSVKIRFIVGNSFPINDNHELAEDDEYLWLAQTALNLSAKSTPSEWKVLMLRHTQSTSITNLSACINAFRQGSSWTYKGTTVNFGSVNGGGMTFIAHIHGHEHQNCFSNGAGYFDIGENAAFLNISYLGDASKYGLSVLSIDTANSRVYEDTIGGQTWCYDYLSNKLVIAVGQIFTPARSGLAAPTISSSDSAVASVDGNKVVAVSAGNATITVSGTNGSYSYPITVVSGY